MDVLSQQKSKTATGVQEASSSLYIASNGNQYDITDDEDKKLFCFYCDDEYVRKAEQDFERGTAHGDRDSFWKCVIAKMPDVDVEIAMLFHTNGIRLNSRFIDAARLRWNNILAERAILED